MVTLHLSCLYVKSSMKSSVYKRSAYVCVRVLNIYCDITLLAAQRYSAIESHLMPLAVCDMSTVMFFRTRILYCLHLLSNIIVFSLGALASLARLLSRFALNLSDKVSGCLAQGYADNFFSIAGTQWSVLVYIRYTLA